MSSMSSMSFTKRFTDAERVSNIFSLACVCRQIYDETKLLQYKKNIFMFSTEFALRTFSSALKDEQRNAISTISIDFEYVFDKLTMYGGGGLPSLFGFEIPTPSFRELLLGKNTVCIAADHIHFMAGNTLQEENARVIVILDLGATCDIDLAFGCYNVLDENADVRRAWSVKFRASTDAGDMSADALPVLEKALSRDYDAKHDGTQKDASE